MIDLDTFLSQTNEHSQAGFEGQKRILSFRQYLDAFCANPLKLGRNAPQYLLECLEHFGIEEKKLPGQKMKHFKMFDSLFDKGEALVGHDEVQQEVYDHLRRFAATGRADRLILLHGPNGSGKSTFVELILRALEHYSMAEDGALFRFNWIFTERLEGKGSLGFGAAKSEIPKDTLAFIDENLVSCKIPCELRESPVFLLPKAERAQLLDTLAAQMPKDTPRVEWLKGEYLREGALSTKSKAIFDALLNAYRGDLLKVLRHVQVERYFISRRYRTGAVVIEPQQHVDATMRPMSFDRGVSLPPVLHGLQLFDIYGDLIDASGGVVEYSDMLKRPLEMNKYLLNTCERGTVSLPGNLAYISLVMFASANEKYLSAFKANPDWTSFKGRMELIRFGYLLDWRKERDIYRDYLTEISGARHVSPHAMDVTALWGVMSRLRRPDPDRYEGELAGIIRGLTPLEKARLYSEGATPDGLNTEQKRLLVGAVPQLKEEHAESTMDFENFTCSAYEGRRGASAREMMTLLAEAANSSDYRCLSPLAVFEAIKELLKDRSVYDFLRLEPDEGYHDTQVFLDQARDQYYRWVSVELYDSMELVEMSEFGRRVDEYFRHVRAYVAGEKIQNERTGAFEEPSEDVMRGLEKLITLKESPDTFRRNLITKIAAYSLEHPKEKLVYGEIFPDLIARLRDSYYKEKQKGLETLSRYILASGTEDAALVPQADRPRVERTLKNMREKYGYCDHCAKEAIGFVLRRLATEAKP
ncbi:MAG: serine protein kinase PrkA [Planctomycetota bacterium]|nr:serine protein kinase PrkA [Planctomycetota bacterium]